MREFWISAYTQDGYQFGDSMTVDSVAELFAHFKELYPNCEIADYGEYEEI